MERQDRETSNTNSSRRFNETTAACEYDVWIYNLSSERFLVRRGRETSNTLFNELEQWEQYLKSENLDVHILALLDENKRHTPKSQETGKSASIKQKSQHRRAAPRLRGPS